MTSNVTMLNSSQVVVRDSSTDYRMNMSGYSGSAGDAHHNGQMFSTYNQDHDSSESNCAVLNRGAWWYKACHRANLNGEYFTGGVRTSKGVTWDNAKPGGGHYSLKSAEMKLKFI